MERKMSQQIRNVEYGENDDTGTNVIPGLSDLGSFTPARVGLGRAGGALPTKERLKIVTAHSSARDAVHSTVNLATLHQGIDGLDEVRTNARTRTEYLRRPDLGRILADDDYRDCDSGSIDWSAHTGEIGIVIADGLSPQAINDHAVPLVGELQKALAKELPGKKVAKPIFVHQGRVAAGDCVSEHADWAVTVVIIGERPGLSVPSSLGMYLTWRAHVGMTDESRNCISNIHPPHGLSYSEAARSATVLINAFYEQGKSGYQIKAVEELGHAAVEA